MNSLSRFRPLIWWLLAVALVVIAWREYGAAGLAMAGGALLFWLLLQFTQVMTVMKRAANRPKGYIRDAAVLHRKLRPGLKLFDIVRATGSLGEPVESTQPQTEIYQWTDSGGVRLICTFVDGRLASHELTRGDDSPLAAQP